mmetsp:Transcript_32103/g.75368  ORF Transcript_32103/g.75368 Transcript_32103/m.75368 type:complete len:283 (+) Transcript_32103:68-916(+)|eukprot:CAMPEP_0178426344 /NCGR_PEP_ID=MMETSP0689_2-20121128/29187_1 /TAXON_ID=160604 /ORGANISM="Amphidinium massartii, Strain CS-259" /LENGTH=282 /DNA_ID=CAMNT_0020048029 /DNA_START=193 /DNA_END=1038 /DNA_ORIENTATION=+
MADASVPEGYSRADQVARTQALQESGLLRYVNIDAVYDPSKFAGKRVLVVGGSRGLGLKIVQALCEAGAKIITTARQASPELEELQAAGKLEVLTGVEMQDTASVAKMAAAIKEPLEYLIHNAGYFMEEKETLKNMNFEEELKQIDICAVAPLRVVSELYKAEKLKETKVAIISSQAGSAAWRFTQNKDAGGDYGHHMSRAACNIAGALMSEELKAEKIPIVLLHPGFNRTEMTAKYSHIWDKEGAVEPAVGAKRVLHEVSMITMETTGKFINCEDGLLIPW